MNAAWYSSACWLSARRCSADFETDITEYFSSFAAPTEAHQLFADAKISADLVDVKNYPALVKFLCGTERLEMSFQRLEVIECGNCPTLLDHKL